MEAERSEQGLQFHLPLSFRHKPPRIALQAVKDRWTSEETKGQFANSCNKSNVSKLYFWLQLFNPYETTLSNEGNT